MKAAVLHALGKAPIYTDFPDPVPLNEDQILIKVTAAAVKNLDKAIASGAHYSSNKDTFQPVVVGVDGVGILEDGSKVYAPGVQGMMAEKALIDKDRLVKLPPQLDDATAAALPNAILGAAAALLYRAKISPGQTVLINGAAGVTGRIAIQLAKYYGASQVIVTGRNIEVLEALKDLGADEFLSLKQEDQLFIKTLRDMHQIKPIDIVIDYLWGPPAELILTALKGNGTFTTALKFITVGAMVGDKIQLSSAVLRSANIELMGSGFGSLPEDAMQKLFREVLPELLQLAAEGKLKIETVTASLQAIASAWDMEVPSGKRLVIKI
jgi:NADPH:quinone reductase-like Zn-dependent oxidoreductase